MSVVTYPAEFHGTVRVGAGEAAPELTIASGVVTVTGSYHVIDTEADAATDDLDTINGGAVGQLLVLTAANAARDVVVKDTTGNLNLNRDFVMNDTLAYIVLVKDSPTTWAEVARSQNTPNLTADPATPGFGEIWYRIDLDQLRFYGLLGQDVIVRTTTANYVDLTDGGATTLHTHAGGSGISIGLGIALNTGYGEF